jgi:hypothetical protein
MPAVGRPTDLAPFPAESYDPATQANGIMPTVPEVRSAGDNAFSVHHLTAAYFA